MILRQERSPYHQKVMDQLDKWHERRDAREARQIEKLRQKNLEEVRSCRKTLEGMPFARFRAKKMRYLDKMEAYIKTWAWMPGSYRRMLNIWLYNEDKKGLEMYDEFLPIS